MHALIVYDAKHVVKIWHINADRSTHPHRSWDPQLGSRSWGHTQLGSGLENQLFLLCPGKSLARSAVMQAKMRSYLFRV
jgi:hypothetical protein